MIQHESVLLDQSIDGLNIQPDGIYVDATFGAGGHSRAILERIKNGKLISFDQDSDTEANLIQDNRVTFIRHNFRFMKNFLRHLGIEKVDGILADLGISSHQIETPERGFSFRFDAPLDMRMNKGSELDAIKILNTYSQKDLQYIFEQYGELERSRSIAETITKARSIQPITMTQELAGILSPHIPQNRTHKTLAQIFQALRIEVNKEIDSLKKMLLHTPDILRPGGRLVVISYHSIEDRIVKNFMRTGNFFGESFQDIYGNRISAFRQLHSKVIVPDDAELERNPRSRSAKLRIGERL